jgi:hypothetical protein
MPEKSAERRPAMYKHYIRLNADNYIIKGFSTVFEQPQPGDICINDDGSYQFRLFPGGTENPMLFDENRDWIYQYINGEIIQVIDNPIYPR